MKKLIVCMCIVTAVVGFTACSKDMPEEQTIIDMAEPGDDGSTSNPFWDWADKYPGPVSPVLDRAFDVDVVVKGGYTPLAYAPETNVLQSTGWYIPSGEDVEIVVPAGSDGLHYQIGIGYKLADGQLRLRYDDVVKTGELHAGTNTVMSYFGGYLFFGYEPDRVPTGDITVTVSGVVPSDDYIKGATNAFEWLLTMRERAGFLKNGSDDDAELAFLNWTELRSDKVILTAGVSEMEALTNPEQVVSQYEKIVDSYYSFSGYDPTGQPPVRLYSDIQVPDALQTAASSAAKTKYYGSYPITFLRGETHTKFVDEKKAITVDVLQALNNASFGNWTDLFFGFGSAFMGEWQKGEYLKDPSFNMGYYHYAATIGVTAGKTINHADNISSINTDENNPWLGNGTLYGSIGTNFRVTMQMQLANYLGWGMYPYLSDRVRELGFWYVEDDLIRDQAANDFFVMTLCEYADRNLLPFFERWKFPCSTVAKKYMKQFTDLSPGEVFWQTYNGSVSPAFDHKSPNKTKVRPPEGRKFTMYDADAKEDWYLSGILWEYAGYFNPNGQVLNAKKTDNSIDSPNWKITFDGDVINFNALFGQLQDNRQSVESNVPQYTMSFVGKEDALPGEPGYVENPTPARFNTFVIWNQITNYPTLKIYDIEYYDDATQNWVSTSPAMFKLLGHGAKLEYNFYYFDEEYTTTKVRFKLQSILGGIEGIGKTEIYEMGFGTIEAE